ncbi:MAG: hypothetical protein FJY76_03530 [Candidatus Aenigmarchaeota archaeon]|nr:hypothetical protein [Candidatus Aenigmarchaeota archaeon]
MGMTSLEVHRKSAKEMLDDIDEKVRSGLVKDRQKLVGFAASEISCDLLAVLLHKKNLISPGFNVNHRFFASEKMAKERFGFDFPVKERILPLMVKQEEYRGLLCYGRERGEKLVLEAIANMNRIREIVDKETGEDI